MKMSWRWYGENNDSVTLNQIKQIPNIETIVWALHNKSAGEVWEVEEIARVVNQIQSYNFGCEVVESVNVHDDIKIGLSSRDKYIDNYIQTIHNLSKFGIKVICYNFMPVFDWTRTDLYKELPDGSNALFYEKSRIEESPHALIDKIMENSNDFSMPGWEKDRLSHIEELLDKYKDVTEEILFENLKYFLSRVIPVCEELDIKMAIHPDDPPWPIYGLPRIIRSDKHIEKFLSLYPSTHSGLTFCTGSLGPLFFNTVPDLVSKYINNIFFMHIRNVKVFENGDFIEVSHKTSDGSIDVQKVLAILHQKNYLGWIRPDHGRHIWGEEQFCRPGYGLYDRALGVMYMHGVIDAIRREQYGETA